MMRKGFAITALAVATLIGGTVGMTSQASAQSRGFHGGGFGGGFHGGGFDRGFRGGRFFGGVGFGFGFYDPLWWGLGYPYYGYGAYYPYYYGPAAYAAPVAYAPPAGAAPAAAPAPAGYDQSNCRPYQTTVQVGGKPTTATGLACRQPDGSWRIAQ
jgi:hypothetical protein